MASMSPRGGVTNPSDAGRVEPARPPANAAIRWTAGTRAGPIQSIRISTISIKRAMGWL